MAKRSAIWLAVVCLLTPLLIAQTPSEKQTGSIPRYIWFSIDNVAPGKWDAYSKVVTQFREAANTSAPDSYWIAATPSTGPSGRVTFVGLYDNMAAVEKGMAAMEAAAKAATAKNASFPAQAWETAPTNMSVIAEFNKDISYRPDLVPISETKWWLTELVSLNAGCGGDMRDIAKQVIATYDKGTSTEHWIAYDIRAGYTQPTVLFVTRLRSLADRDEEPAPIIKEAFGTPATRQMFAKFEKECVRHVETNYSRIEPTLSRPPQAVVAANPEFWTIKEEPTPTAAKKSRAKKPAKATLEPASMKEPEKQ